MRCKGCQRRRKQITDFAERQAAELRKRLEKRKKRLEEIKRSNIRV